MHLLEKSICQFHFLLLDMLMIPDTVQVEDQLLLQCDIVVEILGGGGKRDMKEPAEGEENRNGSRGYHSLLGSLEPLFVGSWPATNQHSLS